MIATDQLKRVLTAARYASCPAVCFYFHRYRRNALFYPLAPVFEVIKNVLLATADFVVCR